MANALLTSLRAGHTPPYIRALPPLAFDPPQSTIDFCNLAHFDLDAALRKLLLMAPPCAAPDGTLQYLEWSAR